MANSKENIPAVHCYHCGENCLDELCYVEEKPFCCFGCKTVYEILEENDLCAYYSMQDAPGQNRRNKVTSTKYEVLDRTDIRSRFVTFEEGSQYHIRFYLPHIHCSSCIWLLENLHTVHDGIVHARVDFRRKEIYIIADSSAISLQEVASLLDSIGYEPYLSLQDMEARQEPTLQRGRVIRIAVAGFCFGNIMLFSAPEYLARGEMAETSLQVLFQYLSLLFSLPVFFYCADEFFISSWKSIKKRFLNIDAPIALAIIITFIRSLYMVFIEGSGGYFDSMSGIVFFMLLGRYFQDRTYKRVSFNRDYTSYFPLSAAVLHKDVEVQVPVTELKAGDVYKVRNLELIPADSILIRGKASIDYSFVTGEADPVEKCTGELIYAGGRQQGAHLELKVIKEVSQSYLTQLWNKAGAEPEEENQTTIVSILSKYFSVIVLGLSVIACITWLFLDPSRALDALVTPLIIACPCALLLSATFTNGNAIAWMGRAGLYVKNADVLEKLCKVSAIVFDKTGTIAPGSKTEVSYSGKSLQEAELSALYSLTRESGHPFSKAIANWCTHSIDQTVTGFTETPGKGISGTVAGTTIELRRSNGEHAEGSVLLINGVELGLFSFRTPIFEGVEGLIKRLKNRYPVYLLSGDSDRDKQQLSAIIDPSNQYYRCTPMEKKEFVRNCQKDGVQVMMFGDGLNDAGALTESLVGVAVAADIHQFTPASDIIMEANQLEKADDLIRYAKFARRVILWSFGISITYNIVGLFFALQGLLQPVIAAILMPLSTITIVLFTTGLSSLYARQLWKKATFRNP